MPTPEPAQIAQYFHELAATLPGLPERAEESHEFPRDSVVSSVVAARINDAAIAHASGTMRNDSVTWAELPWFEVNVPPANSRVPVAADSPQSARTFGDTLDALMRGQR